VSVDTRSSMGYITTTEGGVSPVLCGRRENSQYAGANPGIRLRIRAERSRMRAARAPVPLKHVLNENQR